MTECETRNENDNMVAGDMTFANVNKILKVSFMDILRNFSEFLPNYTEVQKSKKSKHL